jgi:CRISPR-associated protein Csy1
VTAKDPSSHKLGKQLYWPIGDDYHLLLPLYATSLSQELFERVQHARFSEEQKEARAARQNEKESEFATIEFQNIAVQAFGGTKPQNISQLNSGRGGRSFLLSSAPPTWQSQEKPPLKVKSIFRGPFSRKVYGHLIGLKKFLVANLNKRSVWGIRAERARRIDDIVDQLVAYGAGVRTFPAGWSSHPDCHLPLHQKLWLDPNRRAFDKEFEDEFDKKEWQGLVAADFSRFLNAELEKNADIATGDVEFVQWKVLTAQELRLVQDDVKGAF